MKIVLTGGGTAGHVFPALNTGKYLQEKHGAQLYYIGNRDHIEAELAGQWDIPFYAISSRGLEGKNVVDKYVGFGFCNVRGSIEAVRLLKKIKPDLVFGSGGFVSAPVLAAAKWLNIPYAVHEQNAVPGKVNRLFKDRAAYAFYSFPLMETANAVYSGNPVRFKGRLGENGSKAVFLGGSGGSVKLNEAAVTFAREHPHIPCVLVTGKGLYEHVQQSLNAQGGLHNLTCLAYAEDMLAVYKEARMVVCRSGAGTLFELANLSIPPILVPLPTSADDHQKKNALYFEQQGAAITVEQDHQFDKMLALAASELYQDETRRHNMRKALDRLAVRNSEEVIADALMKLQAPKAETAK